MFVNPALDIEEEYDYYYNSTFEIGRDHYLDTLTIVNLAIFTLLSLVGLIAAISVMAIVSSHHDLQSITNKYLQHRSLVNVLYEVRFFIFLHNEILGYFMLGKLLCHIMDIINITMQIANWCFLILLAIDYYLSSCRRSLKYRWKVCNIGIGVIWGLCVVLAIPAYFSPYYYQFDRNGESVCYPEGNIFYYARLPYYAIRAFVPAILVWIFVILGNRSKSARATENDGHDTGYDERMSTSQKLMMALAITTTLAEVPLTLYNLSESYIWIDMIHYPLLYISNIMMALTPVLSLRLKEDLWEKFINCHPRKSASSFPLERI